MQSTSSRDNFQQPPSPNWEAGRLGDISPGARQGKLAELDSSPELAARMAALGQRFAVRRARTLRQAHVMARTAARRPRRVHRAAAARTHAGPSADDPAPPEPPRYYVDCTFLGGAS